MTKSVKLDKKLLEKYINHLNSSQKSQNSIDIYIRYVSKFINSNNDEILSQKLLTDYVEKIKAESKKIQTINVICASINSFLDFVGCDGLKMKPIKIQSVNYRDDKKDLTLSEYSLLITATKNSSCPQMRQLNLIMQTLAGTGMRVSELEYLDLASVKKGDVNILNKGTNRIVLLPTSLCKKLVAYSKEIGLGEKDKIFSLTRQQIWRKMKSLAQVTGIESEKIFPHNLRHLFARTHYQKHGGINSLANILGHKSLKTTMIYTLPTSSSYRKEIDSLELIPK